MALLFYMLLQVVYCFYNFLDFVEFTFSSKEIFGIELKYGFFL